MVERLGWVKCEEIAIEIVIKGNLSSLSSSNEQDTFKTIFSPISLKNHDINPYEKLSHEQRLSSAPHLSLVSLLPDERIDYPECTLFGQRCAPAGDANPSLGKRLEWREGDRAP
jgi:hypothetical protein